MGKPELSIIMPGIRPDRWKAVYESIDRSCERHTWELIILAPYRAIDLDGFNSLPKADPDYPDTLIQTHGSPVRCLQEGLMYAKGQCIGWASDDGIWEQGAIDKALDTLQGPDAPQAVTCKYTEGDGYCANMYLDNYYYFRNHDGVKDTLLPRHYLAFNGPYFLSATTLRSIGGWDCRFEGIAAGCCDLGARLQNAGARCVLQDGIAVKFSHMEGRSGDHGPMHDAHLEHDEPLFRKIYSDPATAGRVAVPLDNWKQAPTRWERRFGKA